MGYLMGYMGSTPGPRIIWITPKSGHYSRSLNELWTVDFQKPGHRSIKRDASLQPPSGLATFGTHLALGRLYDRGHMA
jgi:hypothetical protein